MKVCLMQAFQPNFYYQPKDTTRMSISTPSQNNAIYLSYEPTFQWISGKNGVIIFVTHTTWGMQ
jgi:hypothetical protein